MVGYLFYKSLGQGIPIVVVHGGPGLDQRYLQPQLFEFAKDNRIVFYDQRGSGRSLQNFDDLENITVDQFISDIEQLRKKLDLGKIILMGHSWGGLLSMNYAVKHSENLFGLILLTTAPASLEGQQAFMDTFHEKSIDIIDDIAPLFSYEEFEKQDAKSITDLNRKLLSIYFYNPKNVESLNLVFDVKSARSGFRTKEELVKKAWLVPKSHILPKLKNIDVPTLIVHSDDDMSPVWTAQEIKEAIDDSKFVILEECGHFPYIEKPAEFYNVIRSFLVENNF